MNNYIGIEVEGIKGAHLTLFYFDDFVPDITVLDYLKPVQNELSARRGEFAVFNGKIVVKLDIEESHPFRTVRKLLTDNGYVDASEYEWNPHITLPTNTGTRILLDSMIELKRVYVSVRGNRYYL